jgi:DNA-binding PadR family transcriptional regulator
MAPKQLKVMMLLRGVMGGMFASQIVAASGGVLLRGTIYPLLYKLEGDGWLKSEASAPTDEYVLQRSRYWMTVEGEHHLSTFLDSMGLEPKKVKT